MRMRLVKFVFVVPLLLMAIAMTVPNVLASHSVSPNACYNDGTAAGEDGEFSQELYEFCAEYGERYYEGFIDGCMSVDNSREVCESATDAGDEGSSGDDNEDEGDEEPEEDVADEDNLFGG
jgi:hypothetical protein